ncbi:MAG: methyltransferase domain-containing protein [bacterium]|nr:methyltransferase domain-containing protein [bacterium]
MSVQEKYPYFLKDQRKFFDELITKDWHTYKSNDWDYSREFEVNRLFKKIMPASILDIGCGCGFRDKIMATYPFVEKVDAIDYSEKSIITANSAYSHPKVTRTMAMFETFESKNKYELIVSFQLFEHLDNPEEYLRFCMKHCSPLGHIVISTVNRLRLNNRIRLLKKAKLEIEDPMHYKEYTFKEIREMGNNFGLKTVDFFGYGIFTFKRLSIKRKMLAGYLFPFIADRIVIIFKKP